LTVQSYEINTPTNLTLTIRNPGASPKSLTEYYVKDATDTQYANSIWSGPTIPRPDVAVPVNTLIDGREFKLRTEMPYIDDRDIDL
jgi:hypothetical protein